MEQLAHDVKAALERSRRLRAAALALSCAAASCIVFTGRRGDSIRFPETAHAEVMGDCEACHEGVAGHQVDSQTRSELEAACLRCHAERKHDCGWCHADVASAGVFPEKDRFLTFSHEKHLVRTHGDCSTCHPGAHGLAVEAAGAPREVAMPGHSQCFSCHPMQDFYDRLECGNCHRALARFGLAPYERFTHEVDFARRGHAELLRSGGNAAVCSQCHEAKFCDQCHFESSGLTPPEREPAHVAREFIHRGDYVFRHPWDARADPASCLRCHGRDYCEDCHDSRGISELGALKRTDGYQFHGPGVLFSGSPDFHGTAARRDILSCAVCHAEGASGNCVGCHAVGAFGGNPHPPGFRSRLDKHGAPVCRLCHG
jgi:hypothetical protein